MTARAVLHLMHLMAHRPGGVTAEVAAEHLHKSRSTALNLLNTLCSEGFAQRDGSAAYVLTDPRWVPLDPTRCEDLEGGTDSSNEPSGDHQGHGDGVPPEDHDARCPGVVCWHDERERSHEAMSDHAT